MQLGNRCELPSLSPDAPQVLQLSILFILFLFFLLNTVSPQGRTTCFTRSTIPCTHATCHFHALNSLIILTDTTQRHSDLCCAPGARSIDPAGSGSSLTGPISCSTIMADADLDKRFNKAVWLIRNGPKANSSNEKCVQTRWLGIMRSLSWHAHITLGCRLIATCTSLQEAALLQLLQAGHRGRCAGVLWWGHLASTMHATASNRSAVCLQSLGYLVACGSHKHTPVDLA